MAKKIRRKKKKPLNIEIKLFRKEELKRKFKEYGVENTLTIVYVAYVVAIALAYIMCYVYDLIAPYTIIVIITAILVAPIVLISFFRKQYEYKRFMDANSYMKQLIEGVSDYRMVVPVLENMATLFKEGDMKETLKGASLIIKNATNINIAKKDALLHIEKKYGCENIKMIHDFCIRGEENGGDMKTELRLLEEYREMWVKQTKNHQKNMESVAVMSIVVYICMIFACAYAFYMLKNIEGFSIGDNIVAQTANFMYIESVFIYILFMINKICGPILKEDDHMTMQEVEDAKDYIKNYKRSKSRNLANKYGTISLVALLIVAFVFKSLPFAIIGVIIATLFYSMHLIVLASAKSKMKKELLLSFPKWLFDLCLYMQKDNIVRSIDNTLATAPPIMRGEIKELIEGIKQNPESEEVFLDFLHEYKNEEITETMRMLLALNKGNVQSKEYQMHTLISHNMELISKQNGRRLERQRSYSTAYYYLPMLPTMLVSICYALCIIFNSINFIMDLVG